MQWYNIGNAFVLSHLPLGGGPTTTVYNLFHPMHDPWGPVTGITGPVRAFVDDLDENGDQYPDLGAGFDGGNARPIDPGSLIKIGSTTYTVTNVWHSVGMIVLDNGGTYPHVWGGIHYFEITDGTDKLYLGFPNHAGSLVDPDNFVKSAFDGIISWVDLGHSATTWFNSILPDYLGGWQGTPVCLAAGTRIATPRGPVAVERLQPGDLIETRDHGLLPLRWIGRVWGGRGRLARAEGWRPWRVAPGALGGNLPSRPLVLSAQHRVLVAGPEVARVAGVPAALVAIKHLAGLPGIARLEEDREVEYFHLLFDRHAVLRAEGAWCESLWPGAVATDLAGIDAAPDLCRAVLAAGPALPFLDGRTGRRLARRLATTGRAPVASDPAARCPLRQSA